MSNTLFRLFFLLVLLASHSGISAKLPNILLILVDDLGYADLSSYGSNDLRTLAIDALVEDGMRFDQFYANCPVCSPTRASLMCGRYPDLVGVPGVIRTYAKDSWGYMDPAAVTLPEMLRRGGYHTGMSGKWHLGLEEPNVPNSRGFDHFKGWLGDMMDDYYTHLRHGINYLRDNQTPIEPQGHASDLFSDWAIDYLRHQSTTPSPFFLYLAYNAPHTPIQPPQDWLEKVKSREPGISDKRAGLVALIEHMDHGIGRVVQSLKDLGIYKDTLIVFTSDNGGQVNVGANNGPNRDGKGTMYEGGLKVPFCAVWNGSIESGSRSMVPALTMDIYPTLCEVAGLEIDHKIDGVSLWGLLSGQDTQLLPRDLLWVRREGGTKFMGKTIDSLREGDWKLIQNTPFEPLELYNLKRDPLETEDLAGRERAVFQRLASKMRRNFQRAGRIPWQSPR
jgi:arylsulfatase A-like enzyme